MNRDWFPGDDMFSGTCSEAVMCGTCGYADTTGRHVECGSAQGGRVSGTVPCTYCHDYGNECCKPFQAHDATLREAVDQWFEDRRAALKVYGPIKDWDISKVSTLYRLFDGLRNYHGRHFEGADLSD